MEILLLRIVIWLIVAGALVAIVKAIPAGWVEPWLKQVAMIVIVALLLISLIVYVVVPMVHMVGSVG